MKVNPENDQEPIPFQSKDGKNMEAEYLAWVEANQNGFVVNIDEPQNFPQYPMVHRASHKAISSRKRSNYTTHQYFKVCHTDLEVLERWALREGHSLKCCGTCM